MIANKNKFSNPIIKDEIEILFESDKKLVFRTYLKPKGGQSGLHYHTKITEKFKIIKGNLTVILNDTEKVLKPNDAVIVKPLDKHQFYNTSKEDVIFEVEISPALQIKTGLQILYGIAKDGKTYKNGLPKNIFHMAIGLYMMDAYVPSIFMFIQKAGIYFLAKIGKIIGLEKAIKEKYCY